MIYPFNHLGLFEGIGGFSLAAKWAGFKTIAYSEINPFACKVLNYYFPEADNLGDIKTANFFPYANRITVLTGGFPCQPLSLAGLRKGTADHRYLWPEMLQAIKIVRPPWVIAENVTGILSMEDPSSPELFARVENRKIVRYNTIDHYEAIYTRQSKLLIATICESLEKEGYQVFPIVIPAAAVQAPHKRDRVWIVAHSPQAELYFSRIARRRWTRSANVRANAPYSRSHGHRHQSPGTGSQRTAAYSYCKRRVQSKRNRPPKFSHSNDKTGRTNAHTHKLYGHIPGFHSGKISQLKTAGVFPNHAYPYCPGRAKQYPVKKSNQQRYGSGAPLEAWRNWPTQSPVCFGNDGLPGKLDGLSFPGWRNESLKALGNAVVPQIPYIILTNIKKIIHEQSH